jgi:cell division protein FtsL
MILSVELPGESREQIVMVKKLKMLFLISALFCACGCSLAETRSQNRAIQAENRQVYQIYQKYMQSLNEEREMSGIPPRPVKSYEDWQKSPGTD